MTTSSSSASSRFGMPVTQAIVPVPPGSAHVNDVAGRERLGPGRGPYDEPARAVDVDGVALEHPVARQRHPHRPGRSSHRPRGRRRAGRPPRRRQRAPRRSGSGGRGRAAPRAAPARGRRPPTPRAASDVAVGTGSSSSRRDTFSPTPSTTASSTTSASSPASLRSATSTSLGHLSPSVEAGQVGRPARPRRARRAAAATPTSPAVPSAAAARRSASPERGGAVQVRSARPRPAVCCSATTTSPSAAPARAAAATSAFVEPVSATTRSSVHSPSLDDQRRPQGRSRSGGRSRSRQGLPSRLTTLRPMSAESRLRAVGTEVPDDSTCTRPPAGSPTCTGATTRRCTPGRPGRSRSSTPRAR